MKKNKEKEDVLAFLTFFVIVLILGFLLIVGAAWCGNISCS
jgi:hypothetical protein